MTDRRWQCRCGAFNRPIDPDCEACGQQRVHESPPDSAPHCPLDGAALDRDGSCPRGGGFPLTMRCPFACPFCRQPLEWSGGCLHCDGSATPSDRATWTIPGARYEFDDEHGRPRGDGQHWIRASPAPARSPLERRPRQPALRIRTLLAQLPATPEPTDPARRRALLRAQAAALLAQDPQP